MARSRSRGRKPSDIEAAEPVEEASPAAPDSGDDIAAVAASEPPSRDDEPTVEVVVPIDRTPKITCKRWVIGGNVMKRAFYHEESLNHPKLPRKLTRAAWNKEFEAWCARPRS